MVFRLVESVRVGEEQHLGVGVDGDVELDRVLVAPQEVGHGPGLGFRLGERPTVDLGAGVARGSLRWKEKGEGSRGCNVMTLM